MTDADTPRVPDDVETLRTRLDTVSRNYREMSQLYNDTLTAKHDAELELNNTHRQLTESRAWVLELRGDMAVLRGQLADIHAWLDQPGLDKDVRLVHIRAVLDREPGREEPSSQRTPRSPQTGSSARTLHGIVFPDHIEVDQLNNPETTIIRLQCLPHTFGRVTSGWINRGDTHLIREFVEAHAAHGHVVEHQPDTEEADRG